LAARAGGWYSRRYNRGHEHTAHRRNPNPDIEQKKAAYAALADVLDNPQSRQELIDQLRKVAATPPQEPVPVITPPQIVEQKTVLENVTEVSSHYGEEFASRFAQLYRNITGSPHKAFNPETFTSAAGHFLLLAMLVFAFWLLVRLAVMPLYRKMGYWGRNKNRERNNWLQLPAMIIGAFIVDLLLLALTLFVGQILSANLNNGNRTIAFQQSLFLNAFALIEFFKAICGLSSVHAFRSCAHFVLRTTPPATGICDSVR
jgi:hypothetical protein